MTVTSVIIEKYLNNNADVIEVPLQGGQNVQVLASIGDLPRARKHQYAAFIMDESYLAVWDDNPMNVVQRASDIVENMTKTVWAESTIRTAIDEKKDMTVEIVEQDPESGEIPLQQRPTRFLNSIYVAITLILIIVVLAAGAREIAVETAVDGSYLRCAFLLLTPIQVFFTLVRLPCSNLSS